MKVVIPNQFVTFTYPKIKQKYPLLIPIFVSLLKTSEKLLQNSLIRIEQLLCYVIPLANQMYTIQP